MSIAELASQSSHSLPPKREAYRGVGIEISNLFHHYETDAKRVDTLTDIDLSIAPGDFVALVGQSGCGKSTLLNILSGLITPTRGLVSYHSDQGAEPVVSYLTQEDRLLPWRSVLRNVELPLELQGANKTFRRDLANALLQRVGLADFAAATPAKLSGGMRQRVSIARALSLRPSLLLLDEPFGALDAWNKQTLHELLLELRDEYQATTVLVTHDVFEALALSSKIVTLAPRPGRIVSTYELGIIRKPRKHDQLYSPAFFQTYQKIRADLGLRD